MNELLNGTILTTMAIMRGNIRRNFPVLFLWISLETSSHAGECDLDEYRVIPAASEAAANEAREVLRSQGWSDHLTPENLGGVSMSLAPPKVKHAEASKGITPGIGNLETCVDPFPSASDISRPSEPSELRESKATEYPPNEQALAVLKTVRERQRQRRPSNSQKTQSYLREARAGGMCGDRIEDDSAWTGN